LHTVSSFGCVRYIKKSSTVNITTYYIVLANHQCMTALHEQRTSHR